MSKDFSPQIHWYIHLQYKDLHFNNVKITFDGKSRMVYTEEELADRKRHPALQVMASDIYNDIRKLLSNDQFEKLNNTLQALADADTSNKNTAEFPTEITDWYYNRHDHYYHEPNDAEFMEYIKNKFK